MFKSPQLHFQRFEFKYLFPKIQFQEIVNNLFAYMELDPYVNKTEGYYKVSSLYYDSINFHCFHEKMNGNKRRKKIRLRIYSDKIDENSRIFMEIKSKNDAVVYKDRLEINYEMLNKIIKEDFYNELIAKLSYEDRKVIDKFFWIKYYYGMSPKLLVTYTRKPFVGKFDKNFRVTLDSDIKSCLTSSFDFSQTKEQLKAENLILEVKFNNILPHWFYNLIQRFQLQRISYSKYTKGLISCLPQSNYIFTY